MQIAREPRRKVLIRAAMRAGGPRTDVCIRDISSRGMMIQTSAPPPRGTFVDLDCAGHQIVGLVVWRRERRFGVQTQDRIHVHALASRVPAEILAPPGETSGRRPRAARGGAGSSRTLAVRMEFAVIAVFAAVLVAAIGLTAFRTLSRPFDAVSSMLGP
jgi:Flp pilus assembly pilin Flp